ncbi:hypothetical protein ACGFR8_08070 [Streptomyces brevispora]|uniref:hypothetical protein n=1 Tax=Streptomyces brevispora TaxID=887462 RepID=UPI00371BFC61
MATKKFALNTDPHVAEIGEDLTLKFRPEVMGDEFLDVYEVLQEHLKAVEKDDATVDELRASNAAIRKFMSDLMLPESAAEFEKVQLPARVLGELMDWLMGVYGGGERPPTSSTGSATASPPRGTRGTATSRSKASTRARGR